MAIGKTKSAFIGASLAASALTGGCANIHEYNTNTCVKTDILAVKEDVQKILTLLFPPAAMLMGGYRHIRPVQNCNDSQLFMALVDIAETPGNERNYVVNGAVVAAYDKLAAQANGKNDSAKTMAFIDQRLEQRGLTIDSFRTVYETNRPKEISSATENACSKVTVRVNGELVDQRVCGMNGFLPKPAAPAVF